MEEDIKRQRIQYNGDQIYPNVRKLSAFNGQKIFKNNFQLWSSKWCGVKEEPKQQLGISSVISMSTPPHNNNNNNPPNNSNSNNPASNNNNNPSANNNNSSYYDTHNVFPSSVNNNNNQDAILSYETISQAQNTLYAPSIGTAIGEFGFVEFYDF